MFPSLPPSLLTLAFCLLDSRVLADSPSPSPTTQNGNIGSYVASGLGMDNGSTQQTTAPVIESTGSGPEYASKCNAALTAWSSSSFSWQWANDIVSTSTFSSAFTETLQKPGTTHVTSSITLCDGHPRVVGFTSASAGDKYTTTVAWTNTITDSQRNTAYPTPAPCSINPSDCKALSKSYDSSLSSVLSKQGWATGGGPLCTVTPSSSYSYSTNPKGQTCDNCMIAASTARVMFWPVTTASGGNLCNNTASTITASPTGPPNSFITEGVTITSPTVAVSLAYMSRVDGCGTTIAHTIIPVRPEEVTSVRGYRALFSHHRFNFADLNYFCMDTNTTNVTIADGKGDSCYQQVPAAAYFGGLNNAVVLAQAPFWNLTKEQMTIWDDYQPQLLPPATMTKAITSLWGEDCIIHPDGVWDPPIALTPEANLIVPTYPGGDSDAPESTPANPINSYGAQPARPTGIRVPTQPSGGDATSAQQHFTALPETDGYGGDGGSGSGNGQGSGDNSGSGSNSGSNNNDAGQSSAGSSNGGGVTQVNVHTTVITVGNKVLQCTEDSKGAYIIPDVSTTHTASPGGPPVEIGSVTLTADGNGIVTMHDTNTVLTIGNKAITGSQDASGNWIVPDSSTTHTVSQGGSAVQIDGVMVTAASQGLVRTDGSDDSTESGTGTSSQAASATRSNGAQSTGATGSDGAAAATNTDSSGSGAMGWSPVSLAFALVFMAICML